MLKIRRDGFALLHLEKSVGNVDGYGIWEYFVAASSTMFPGFQAGRHAALKPAEPKEGQEVEAFALLHPRAPQSEWRSLGKGVAHYQ